VKASYSGLAAVGLAVAGLWYVGGGSAVPPAAAAAELPRVSAPLAHDNLTVYFVHGPDAVADAHKVATLQEALAAGWAVVIETGDVNTLAVENRSDEYELFIQDGELIKGGKQDRMIAGSMLVPPRSGVVPFRAHCVEQGRWQGRGGEAVGHFHTSDQLAVGNELRLANAAGRQGAVWENVKKNQDKLSQNLGVKVNAPESESSLQLALENKALQDRVAAFETALKAAGEERRGVVGVVFVVNGQVTAAEVYGSNALFRKAWPKLLRSQAAGAVADKTDKPCPPPPTAREVERFLALAATAEPLPAASADATPSAVVAGLPEPLVTDARQLVFQAEEIRAGQIPIGGEVNTNGTNTNPAFAGRSGATRNVVAQGGGGRARTELNHPATPARNDDREAFFLGALNDAEAPGPDGRRVAVNPDGNRLAVNRVDNGAGLVTEARDPGRQGAVIHRSFIKK
jgi:hypothetical protein